MPRSGRSLSALKSVTRRGFAPLVSCEHASRAVPERHQEAFNTDAARELLKSHSGYDRGARELARVLARTWDAPLFEGQQSRLLIDLNRSAHHRRLFSEFSAAFTTKERQELLRIHTEYQEQIKETVRKLSQAAPVLHLAVHSFTPILDGKSRSTDIGLLFDPQRREEAAFAHALQRRLQSATNLRIHRNAPYRGVADGLPTILRRSFFGAQYLGFELELNQRLLGKNQAPLFQRIVAALQSALGD